MDVAYNDFEGELKITGIAYIFQNLGVLKTNVSIGLIKWPSRLGNWNQSKYGKQKSLIQYWNIFFKFAKKFSSWQGLWENILFVLFELYFLTPVLLSG